jgi:hypothetical protein
VQQNIILWHFCNKLNKEEIIMKKSLIATMLAGLFATSANAGIVIPAGEWTLDVNGNVNAFANYTKAHGNNVITGGLAA